MSSFNFPCKIEEKQGISQKTEQNRERERERERETPWS